jgi:hypothetical protein
MNDRSAITNARAHCQQAKYVVTVDLEDFFGSIHTQTPPDSLACERTNPSARANDREARPRPHPNATQIRRTNTRAKLACSAPNPSGLANEVSTPEFQSFELQRWRLRRFRESTSAPCSTLWG